MLLEYEIWKTSSMLFQKFPYNEDDSLETVKDDEDLQDDKQDQDHNKDQYHADEKDHKEEDDEEEVQERLLKY